jgi:hypothetical protein
MTECVQRARLQAWKAERNSKRDKANEYAKGIYDGPDTKINGTAIHLDNFDDEDEGEEQNILYHNSYTYDHPGENNQTQFDQKDDYFADEIHRIKHMFN